MVTRLTATEAARNFSELLTRVAAGEEIEIVRNGATVAVLAPPRRRLLTQEAFRELLRSAPRVDDAFAADLGEIRRESRLPEEPWPS
jgi:prevent-host-death family protein